MLGSCTCPTSYWKNVLFIFTRAIDEIIFGYEFGIIHDGLVMNVDLPHCLFMVKVLLNVLLLFWRRWCFNPCFGFNCPCLFGFTNLDDPVGICSAESQLMFSLITIIYILFWVCLNLSIFWRFFILMFSSFWYRWIYCW